MGTSGQTNNRTLGHLNEDNLIFLRVDNLTKSELDKDGKKKVLINEEEIALISHQSKIYAVQEKCPHYGGPLHEGDIEDLPENGGTCIKCPWHSWKFNLTTGKCISPKNRDSKVLRIFPTRLDSTGQFISIGFEKISPKIFNEIPP